MIAYEGFFERELKKNDIAAHEPTGVEESPAPRDIVDLEVRFSDVRIVFFHFESNRIVELLFEISNRIE